MFLCCSFIYCFFFISCVQSSFSNLNKLFTNKYIHLKWNLLNYFFSLPVIFILKLNTITYIYITILPENGTLNSFFFHPGAYKNTTQLLALLPQKMVLDWFWCFSGLWFGATVQRYVSYWLALCPGWTPHPMYLWAGVFIKRWTEQNSEILVFFVRFSLQKVHFKSSPEAV